MSHLAHLAFGTLAFLTVACSFALGFFVGCAFTLTLDDGEGFDPDDYPDFDRHIVRVHDLEDHYPHGL